MSFMRTVCEVLGEDYDALCAQAPAPVAVAPASPRVQPTTPEGYTIAYAYSPRENVGSGGRCHLITTAALEVGRLKRAPGDALCKPRKQFWGLDGGRTPEDFETYGCVRCSAIRDRLAATSIQGIQEPFCACGRRWSDCDGSRATCHRRAS